MSRLQGVLVSVVWLAFAAGCGGAQPARQPQNRSATPAKPEREAPSRAQGSRAFDFYVLSLSWSPEHCATSDTRRSNELQCAGERKYGFVLHGLWPQFEKGWPEDCSADPIGKRTVEGMLDIMPSAGLVRHEWRKHGTCSGLDAEQYFAKARQAFEGVKIPQQYKQPTVQVVSTPREVRKRFAEANPAFQENGIAVVCRGRFLQEVRACLTTDLQPRPCNGEELRNQCRAAEIILRPVR